MPTFAERIAAHVADVFLNTGHFGEAATYTATGGSPASVNVVVNRNDLAFMNQAGGNWEVLRVRIYAGAEDVTNPQRGDQIALTQPDGSGTDTYRVDSWQWQGDLVILTCVLLTGEEVGGEGLRSRRV